MHQVRQNADHRRNGNATNQHIRMHGYRLNEVKNSRADLPGSIRERPSMVQDYSKTEPRD